MENKYYTPEITEFHVGFEYQFKDLLKDKWIPHKLGEVSCFMWDDINKVFDTFSHMDTLEGYFRVKYLNKSDIEDLGWKFVEKFSDEEKEVMSFQKGNWILIYNFVIKKIVIFVKDYSEEYDLFGSARDVKISGLEVKNKSELKKLIANLKIGE